LSSLQQWASTRVFLAKAAPGVKALSCCCKGASTWVVGLRLEVCHGLKFDWSSIKSFVVLRPLQGSKRLSTLQQWASTREFLSRAAPGVKALSHCCKGASTWVGGLQLEARSGEPSHLVTPPADQSSQWRAGRRIWRSRSTATSCCTTPPPSAKRSRRPAGLAPRPPAPRPAPQPAPRVLPAGAGLSPGGAAPPLPRAGQSSQWRSFASCALHAVQCCLSHLELRIAHACTCRPGLAMASRRILCSACRPELAVASRLPHLVLHFAHVCTGRPGLAVTTRRILCPACRPVLAVASLVFYLVLRIAHVCTCKARLAVASRFILHFRQVPPAGLSSLPLNPGIPT